LRTKTIWWILGLGIVAFLAWIGLRAYRNHLRTEEEMGEYDHESVPSSDTPSVSRNHPKLAPETAAD
jgi:hypothetical protein